jgi:hypothetical protein
VYAQLLSCYTLWLLQARALATKQQHAAAVLQQQREFDAKQDELQALADAANQRAAQVHKLTIIHHFEHCKTDFATDVRLLRTQAQPCIYIYIYISQTIYM